MADVVVRMEVSFESMGHASGGFMVVYSGSIVRCLVRPHSPWTSICRNTLDVNFMNDLQQFVSEVGVDHGLEKGWQMSECQRSMH